VAWFRRDPAPSAVPEAPPSDPGDSPEALRTAIASVNRLVNSSAGRLPLPAVVSARRVTDVLAEIVETSSVRPLDVHAVISVSGAATDYLPTTIHGYLPSTSRWSTSRGRPGGRRRSRCWSSWTRWRTPRSWCSKRSGSRTSTR
jgi:hypothetical protein